MIIGCGSEPSDSIPVENIQFNLTDDVLDLGSMLPTDSGKIYAIAILNDTGEPISGPVNITGNPAYEVIHQRNCEALGLMEVCTVRLYFSPKNRVSGEYAVEVAIGSLVKNISANVLASSAIQKPISISVSELDFGDLALSSGRDLYQGSFTIRNNTGKTIRFSSLFAQPNPGSISVTENCPTNIPPKVVCRGLIVIDLSSYPLGENVVNLSGSLPEIIPVYFNRLD